MKLAVAGALLLAGCAAQADRLISIPLGRKIPFQTIRLESFAEVSRARSLDRFVGVGLTPEFELDYHGERLGGGPIRDTFDFSYNYVTPLTNQAPGFSAGVQDALNRTRDGRRVYVAVTYRDALDGVMNGNVPMEVTLGLAQGRQTKPFVGVMLPLQPNLRLLVEHNGIRPAAGLELRGFNNLFGARLIFRERETMVGANLIVRF